MGLRFAPVEAIQAYRETLGDSLRKYGRPVALCSDKHDIFRTHRRDQKGELFPFTRAVMILDIAPIQAHRPHTKGRARRANQTLQDRLGKGLRRQGWSDINVADRVGAPVPGRLQRPLCEASRRPRGRPSPPCCTLPGSHRPIPRCQIPIPKDTVEATGRCRDRLCGLRRNYHTAS